MSLFTFPSMKAAYTFLTWFDRCIGTEYETNTLANGDVEITCFEMTDSEALETVGQYHNITAGIYEARD